jgi:hypothetical protein
MQILLGKVHLCEKSLRKHGNAQESTESRWTI